MRPADRHGAADLLDVLERESESETEGFKDGWRDYPRDAPFPSGAAWIGLMIARALAHAHSRGVVHRDVKPANIFLAVREGPQLLDFNLAHAPSNAEQAESARSGGTLPYMAPEQLEAFLDPDHWDHVGPASDLYALGLVMIELLTGRRPDGPNPELPLPRAIRGLLDRRLLLPVSPRATNPEIPHTLASILLRCLSPKPADRYTSAEALAEDLERFLDDRPVPSAVGVPRSERASRWFRRHRLGLSALNFMIALTMPLAVGFDAWRKPPVVDPSAFVASGNDRLKQGFELQKQGQTGEARRVFELARTDFIEAMRQAPDLYTSYTGLAFLEGHVDHDFERAIELQRQAITLANHETSFVPAEKKAELAKNLTVAVLGLFRTRSSQKTLWPVTSQDAVLVESVRNFIRQIPGSESPSDRVEPSTRFELFYRIAFLQSQLGDQLKLNGKSQLAKAWYRSAFVDAQSAFRQALKLKPTDATQSLRIRDCQSILIALKREIHSTAIKPPAEHQSTVSITP